MSGWRYKWVRTDFQGAPDTANIRKHLDRGWAPVPVNEIPEFMLSEAAPTGGLTAYRMPDEDHDRLTGAMLAENARQQNWTDLLPAYIQDYSHDAKEAIMCKLEDLYHPTVCAHNPKLLGEANALRRQLGQPERTRRQEQRDALEYYAKKWPETDSWGRTQMRAYRIEFRMPKNLGEIIEMWTGDLRRLFASK